MVRVIECVELEDGPIMWEDKLAYDLARANWSEAKVEQLEWKIKQILYGRNHTHRFTMFVATVEKMGQLPDQRERRLIDAARDRTARSL